MHAIDTSFCKCSCFCKSRPQMHQMYAQMRSGFPEQGRSYRFRIQYESETDFFTRITFYNPTAAELQNITEIELNHTITRLDRDTEYAITIRAEYRYPFSPFLCTSFETGNYSEPFIVSTNSTRKPLANQEWVGVYYLATIHALLAMSVWVYA